MRKPHPAWGLLRTRPVIVLIAGLALATSLVFGFVLPMIFGADAPRQVVSYNPGLVDLVSLVLNVVLLITLVWVVRRHRDPPEANR